MYIVKFRDSKRNKIVFEQKTTNPISVDGQIYILILFGAKRF